MRERERHIKRERWRWLRRGTDEGARAVAWEECRYKPETNNWGTIKINII